MFKMTESRLDSEVLEEAKRLMKWITYKGKEILIHDYTNLLPKQIGPLVEAVAHITFETGKKNLLVIVDISNSYGNKEDVNAFKTAGKVYRLIVKKTAVLGITGLKKILINVVSKFSKIDAKQFNSIEEAKEWLVS